MQYTHDNAQILLFIIDPHIWSCNNNPPPGAPEQKEKGILLTPSNQVHSQHWQQCFLPILFEEHIDVDRQVLGVDTRRVMSLRWPFVAHPSVLWVA